MTRIPIPRAPLMLASLGLLVFCAQSLRASDPEPNNANAGVTAELRQNTQALLDAIAPGNVSVWERLLDDRMIQTDENDIVRGKAQVLAELSPLPAGLVGHLKIADFRVARREDVAVVSHEDDEYLDYHGQIIRSRYRMTDTWVQGSEGWRLLGSQALAVLQDPPAQSLPASMVRQYVGNYRMSMEITGNFLVEADGLMFRQPGTPDRHFRAEVKDVFFEPGRPRQRRIFTRNGRGEIIGFVDRREARDIVWKRERDRTAPPRHRIAS